MEKLPEKWFISKCNNKEDWKKVIDFFNEGVGTQRYDGVSERSFYYPNFFDFKGFREGSHSGCLSKHENDQFIQYTEITMKQFKKHILKEENMKKIIGYKAKKLEYEVAFRKMNTYLVNINKITEPVWFAVDSGVYELAKSLNVLDIWFEAVYEENFKEGDWVYIISGGIGAHGIDTKVGQVTSKKDTDGLTEQDVDYGNVSVEVNGRVWGLNKIHELRLATPSEIEECVAIKIGDYKVEIRRGAMYINGEYYFLVELEDLARVWYSHSAQIKSLSVGCHGQYQVDLKTLYKIISHIKAKV